MTIQDRLERLSDSKRELLARMTGRAVVRESVAVVGMACRFPGGANDPASFWRLLRDGRDAIVEVPRDRWDVDRYYDPNPDAPGKVCTRWGGFLDGIDQFDAPLFGITRAEADQMDPQQRLLLETSWEALESAGCPPLGLTGTKTGVFVGLFQSAYGELLAQRGDAVDVYSASGVAHCTAVGRLSFLLGLQGPSVPVNTACSSSLVAVHLACQSLLSGETDLSLAGGVNAMLSLSWLIGLCRLGVVSPDGRCRSFDAGANGLVESEGCGVLVLKRLSDAQAAGDRVLAVIRGSAVNHSGRSASLTAPSGVAQQAVLRKALAAAGVSPAELSYLEAQGTGTVLGDSVEIEAAASVLSEGRKPGDRLWLSSVKPNIGHAEAASGVAGLIKVILSMQHGAVPPHLHFHKPNASLDRAPFAVPTELAPWPRGDRPRLAGVSSFGMSGVNAHVVLQEAMEDAQPGAGAGTGRTRHLFCLSAQTEPGLRQLAQAYRAHLAAPGGAPALGALALTAGAGRSHLAERLSVTAGSAQELDARLDAFLQGGPAPFIRARASTTGRPKVAFLFSGEGDPPSAGRQLHDLEPVFRQTLEACAEAVRDLVPHPLLHALLGGPPAGCRDLACLQPLQYALQCALFDLWKSWGVSPDAVLGHGLGELAAARAAGALSLEDGARLAARRGRLMQSLPPAERGNPDALAPAAGDYERAAAQVAAARPGTPLFSSSTGAEVPQHDARHLRLHLRPPQRLQDGLKALLGTGATLMVEIGPGDALAALAAAALRPEQVDVLPSLRSGEDSFEVLLSAAGALHARGVALDFRAMARPFGYRAAPAPTYPFQRQRYWVQPVPGRSTTAGAAGASLLPTTVQTPRGEVYLEGELGGEREGTLLEHQVQGVPTLPAGAALLLMLSAASSAARGERVTLHQLRLEAPVALGQGCRVQVWLGAESGGARRVELHARALQPESAPWTRAASAEVRRGGLLGDAAHEVGSGLEALLDRGAIHGFMGKRGITWGPSFQALERMRVRGLTAVADVRASSSAPWDFSPAAAEACLQAPLVLQQSLLEGGSDAGWTYLAVAAEAASLAPGAAGALRCEVSLRGKDAGGKEVIGDVRALDAAGQVVLEVRGLALSRTGQAVAAPAPAPVQEVQRPEEGRIAALLGRLRGLPFHERLGALQLELRAFIAGTLGLPELETMAPGYPLANMGVDSLRAVELRNAFGKLFDRSFPSTLLFDYGTVEALAQFLAQEDPGLRAVFEESPATPVQAGPPDELLARLARLSDEEAESLLAASLANNTDR